MNNVYNRNNTIPKQLIFEQLENLGFKVHNYIQLQDLDNYLYGRKIYDYNNSISYNKYQTVRSGSDLYISIDTENSSPLNTDSKWVKVTPQQINIKNQAYENQKTNIYEIGNRILNNLPYILKTKGTRQSIYSLMNCYGISDNMIQLIQEGGIQLMSQSLQYTDSVRDYCIKLTSGSQNSISLQ